MNLHEEQECVQKAMNNTLSGLQADPWLVRRVLVHVKGETMMGRKLSASMVIAIVLIILSITAAVAAGLGLFEKLSKGENADVRLKPLSENAEKIAVKATTDGGVTVEIDEAYYEGNRVFVSFRMTGNVDSTEVYDGVPDREYEWGEEREDYIMAEYYTSDDEIIQQKIDLMDGKGQRWMVSRGATPNEPVYFMDGTFMQNHQSFFQRQEDGSWIGWKECAVPEDKTAESLTLKLKLTEYDSVSFQDYTTFHECFEDIKETEIPFTVVRNDNLIRLEGSTRTETYEAKAEFTCGQIDLQGNVTVSGEAPEEWADYWDHFEKYQETGKDMDSIMTWILIKDGEEIEPVNEEPDLRGSAWLAFERMDDLEGLSLAPLYSDTWIHLDEAIPLTVITEATADPVLTETGK